MLHSPPSHPMYSNSKICHMSPKFIKRPNPAFAANLSTPCVHGSSGFKLLWHRTSCPAVPQPPREHHPHQTHFCQGESALLCSPWKLAIPQHRTARLMGTRREHSLAGKGLQMGTVQVVRKLSPKKPNKKTHRTETPKHLRPSVSTLTTWLPRSWHQQIR